MMRISTRTRYGVRLMLELALAYGQGVQNLRDIAQREEISEKYLSQIILILKSKGLVYSDRGAHGGYMLARHPEKITLAEIVEALEGSLKITECIDNHALCKRISACVTREVWARLNEEIKRLLTSITLADLARMSKDKQNNLLLYAI